MGTHRCRNIDCKEGVCCQEHVSQAMGIPLGTHHMSIPCDQPTQAEVVLTL